MSTNERKRLTGSSSECYVSGRREGRKSTRGTPNKFGKQTVAEFFFDPLSLLQDKDHGGSKSVAEKSEGLSCPNKHVYDDVKKSIYPDGPFNGTRVVLQWKKLVDVEVIINWAAGL